MAAIEHTPHATEDSPTLALQIAAAIDRRARNEALAAILARLDQARREHADHYLAQRLRRETDASLS